jgi:hypothetical protein
MSDCQIVSGRPAGCNLPGARRDGGLGVGVVIAACCPIVGRRRFGFYGRLAHAPVVGTANKPGRAIDISTLDRILGDAFVIRRAFLARVAMAAIAAVHRALRQTGFDISETAFVAWRATVVAAIRIAVPDAFSRHPRTMRSGRTKMAIRALLADGLAILRLV